MPIVTFDGKETALFFEVVPKGAFDALRHLRYDEDPKLFERTVLSLLAEHFPGTRERIDDAVFGLRSPLDVLQGAIVPTVRRAAAQLPNGRWVMAFGDLHVVNDPIMGQGANAASQAAFVLGQAILDEGPVFDGRFCAEVERRMWDWTGKVTEWNNYMLQVPPAANVLQLLLSAAENKAVADIFADNFAQPSANWNILSSFERTKAFLASHGVSTPLLDQAMNSVDNSAVSAPDDAPALSASRA
jgi:hypothetical protein